jgi:PadR family transcriptional regulator, regulatory protein PadR
MPRKVFLGEFEQLVLLAILQLDNDTGALALLRKLEALAGRGLSRGALYRTLDRLEAKGWITAALDDEERPERGGHPLRRFQVTPYGITALRSSRETLLGLWRGLERKLR